MLLAIVAHTGLECKFNLSPSLTNPAVRVNLQLQTLRAFDDSRIEFSFHFSNQNRIWSKLLVGCNNKALVIDIASISLEVNAKYTVIVLQSLSDNFDIILRHPIVRQVDMHQRFIFSKCIAPSLCKHRGIVLTFLLSYISFDLRLPIFFSCDFISVSLPGIFYFL